MSGPARITVPYTTFIQQLNADNVKDITAQANSIQGDFKKSVTSGSASGTLFQTERPVFATDNLEALDTRRETTTLRLRLHRGRVCGREPRVNHALSRRHRR